MAAGRALVRRQEAGELHCPEPEHSNLGRFAVAGILTGSVCLGPRWTVPGYEALKIVEDVKAEAAKFRLCTSKDALKEVSEDLAAPKKLYQTLLTACKKALAELRGAKT